MVPAARPPTPHTKPNGDSLFAGVAHDVRGGLQPPAPTSRSAVRANVPALATTRENGNLSAQITEPPFRVSSRPSPSAA
jgi:hypothetical protein